MGTDIHAVWQAKKDGKWVDVESDWDQDRHYFLFSWLANVRNGFGFAGVLTYTPVKPISDPRGMPDDFIIDDYEHHTVLEAVPKSEYLTEEEKKHPSVWMGDHSHSWLSADEILSTPEPSVWKTGIVERDFFDNWDGHTPPESWSGGIAGKDIIVAENPVLVTSETTHVRISWKQPSGTLDYFINEVKRLKELHGDVRLVFGFDS